jgi:hypothetical protein
MRLPRLVSRTPVAVGGILATPLFFVGLMAMSLAHERPRVDHVVKHGKSVAVLGNPSGSTEATIWLLALAFSAIVVLVGLLAMFAPRFGVVAPAVAAIVITAALLVPLHGWARDHAARYPDGVDLIPKNTTGDLLLRGEWESSARTAADQIGGWTIRISGLAIVLSVASTFRRRRMPVPPPPPETTVQAIG